MNTQPLGETSAKAIDALLEDFGEESEIVAVAIIIAIESRNSTYVRVHSSSDRVHEKLGLVEMGREVILAPDAEVGDDEDE